MRHFVFPFKGVSGAGERIRTSDLRITNALLYQLSYTGTLFIFEAFISRRDAHFTELFEKCKSAIKFFRPSSDSVFFEADSGEKTRTSDLRITSIQLQSIGRSVLRREHDFALDLVLFLLDKALHKRIGNQLRRQNGFVRLKLETTDRLISLPGRSALKAPDKVARLPSIDTESGSISTATPSF